MKRRRFRFVLSVRLPGGSIAFVRALGATISLRTSQGMFIVLSSVLVVSGVFVLVWFVVLVISGLILFLLLDSFL